MFRRWQTSILLDEYIHGSISALLFSCGLYHRLVGTPEPSEG